MEKQQEAVSKIFSNIDMFSVFVVYIFMCKTCFLMIFVKPCAYSTHYRKSAADWMLLHTDLQVLLQPCVGLNFHPTCMEIFIGASLIM